MLLRQQYHCVMNRLPKFKDRLSYSSDSIIWHQDPKGRNSPELDCCSVSGTHCNISSKRAIPTGVLNRWHNCLHYLHYLLTHKLFTSCIRRYPVSRACNWVMPALSAVLRIFSFQFSLLFLHVGSQTPAAAYVVYPISDIWRCRKFGKYVSCTRRTYQGNDFELILTVKL